MWAANKYLILACSQQDYNQIRQLLKPNQKGLEATYHLLKQVDERFSLVPSSALPQISNALYRIAGYFKKLISKDKGDELI